MADLTDSIVRLFASFDREADEARLASYLVAMQDIDPRDAAEAVKWAVCNCEHLPNAGKLRQIVLEQRIDREKTESEQRFEELAKEANVHGVGRNSLLIFMVDNLQCTHTSKLDERHFVALEAYVHRSKSDCRATRVYSDAKPLPHIDVRPVSGQNGERLPTDDQSGSGEY